LCAFITFILGWGGGISPVGGTPRKIGKTKADKAWHKAKLQTCSCAMLPSLFAYFEFETRTCG